MRHKSNESPDRGIVLRDLELSSTSMRGGMTQNDLDNGRLVSYSFAPRDGKGNPIGPGRLY